MMSEIDDEMRRLSKGGLFEVRVEIETFNHPDPTLNFHAEIAPRKQVNTAARQLFLQSPIARGSGRTVLDALRAAEANLP